MAASSLLDVCRFTPTLGGTTDWTYSSAVTGYQSPTAAGAVNGAQYSYRAESSDLSQWEIGTGAYNSGTGVFARTTVLFSSTGSKVSFSAAPQVAIVALKEDLGTLNNATLSAAPADPTGTTSTTGAMMGLGTTCKLTPAYSGRINLEFYGVCSNTVGGGSARLNVRFGTGTAPSNGAAPTGTQVGSQLIVSINGSGQQIPYKAGGIITGLTPGTSYWFDVDLFAGANTANILETTCNAFEF